MSTTRYAPSRHKRLIEEQVQSSSMHLAQPTHSFWTPGSFDCTQDLCGSGFTLGI